MLTRLTSQTVPRTNFQWLAAITFAVLAAQGFAARAQTAPADAASVTLAPFSSAAAGQLPAPWRVVGVPGGKVPLTAFQTVALDGKQVMRVEADKSYGNLVHAVPAGFVPAPGLMLRWRWRLDQSVANADLRRREGDDVALKVCALFDQPLDKLKLIDRTVLRLARAATAEELPSATVCYVWDPLLATGTLLPNAYSARVRLIVVNGSQQGLGQWSMHARDLAADFKRAFAEEGTTVPPLTAVLVGADADNTGGRSLGYVGDVSLSP